MRSGDDLLVRGSVSHTVHVGGMRGVIVNGSGGADDHGVLHSGSGIRLAVDNGRANDGGSVLANHRTMTMRATGGHAHVLLVAKVVVLVVLAGRDGDGLEFTSKHHSQALRPHARLQLANPGPISPFVQLSSHFLGFTEELLGNSAGQKSVSPRCVDMGDGGVDYGALGWTANLSKVGKEGGEIEEASIESFAASALHGVVGGTSLSSSSAFTSSIACIVVEVSLGLLRLGGGGGRS